MNVCFCADNKIIKLLPPVGEKCMHHREVCLTPLSSSWLCSLSLITNCLQKLANWVPCPLQSRGWDAAASLDQPNCLPYQLISVTNFCFAATINLPILCTWLAGDVLKESIPCRSRKQAPQEVALGAQKAGESERYGPKISNLKHYLRAQQVHAYLSHK